MTHSLTEARIARLKPKRRRYAVHDGLCLALEVLPSGAKMWRMRFHPRIEAGVRVGASRNLTLGEWPAVTLEAARREAKRLRAAERAGEPLTVGERAAGGCPTVAEFAARYVAEVVRRDRKTPAQMEALLKGQVLPRLGRRPVDKVTGAEVRDLVFQKRDAGKPAAAAALRNLIKRMWDYAVVCGAATGNPAHAVPLKFIQRSRARARTLSRSEVGRFLRALEETDRMTRKHKDALKLILLTLCRKSELRLAAIGEFDRGAGVWEIPAEHSKTGRAHIVHLSRQALEIVEEAAEANRLGGGQAQPEQKLMPAADSWTQPMSQCTLNRAMARVSWGMPHFTIHDLRRTGATLLAEAGWPSDVIERALNHQKAGIRGVYNRAEHGEERRKMLQAWADMLDEMQGPGKCELCKD